MSPPARPLPSGAAPAAGARVEQMHPKRRVERRWLAPLALSISMALWGSVHPLVKFALRDLGPAEMVFLRVFSAGLLLVAVGLVSGRGSHLVAQLRRPLSPGAQGLLGYFATMALSTTALQFVPAAVNALLINLSPIFTVLLGALVLSEPLTRRAALGIGVGFLGVGLVTLSGQQVGGLDAAALPGVGIGLVAALCWAGSTIATRLLAKETVDPLAATGLAAVFAALPLGLIAGPDLAVRALLAAPLSSQLIVLWTGIVATGATFVVWSWALARMRAGRVAAFQYLVAPTALVLAWPILGEKPAPLLVVGMALVLLGVAAVQRR